MEREPVQSSNLKSVGYDPDSKQLEVEFHSGAVHRYEDVPAKVHQRIMSAKSPGSYFHNNVRSAYKSTQLL